MKKANATAVGGFVLGALALIVAAIVVFGSGTLLRHRIPIVSFFPGSVAGLRVGAPVTYRGVHVGAVKTIGLRLFPDMTNSIVEVHMELVPEAVRSYGIDPRDIEDMLPVLVTRGLSAQLQQESFVTGQLLVDLDFRPGVKAKRWAANDDEVMEVPSVPSPFQAIAQQLQQIDLAVIVEKLQATLASAQGLLTDPNLVKTLAALPQLVADMRGTAQTIQQEVRGMSGTSQRALLEASTSLQKSLAAVQSLAQTLERESVTTLAATRDTVKTANSAMGGANALLDPRGDTMVQLQRAIDDLAESAARLRNVSERVDRDPAVIIRGR